MDLIRRVQHREPRTALILSSCCAIDTETTRQQGRCDAPFMLSSSCEFDRHIVMRLVHLRDTLSCYDHVVSSIDKSSCYQCRPSSCDFKQAIRVRTHAPLTRLHRGTHAPLTTLITLPPTKSPCYHLIASDRNLAFLLGLFVRAPTSDCGSQVQLVGHDPGHHLEMMSQSRMVSGRRRVKVAIITSTETI